MLRIRRQMFKQVLRVLACFAVVYSQGDGQSDSNPRQMLSQFQARIVCDMRWWLQMAPLSGQDEWGSLDESAANRECHL